MFSWIPFLGPIIQGISSIFSGYFSEKTAQINADVQMAQVSEQIIRDTNDDICLRILRDGLCLPAVIWFIIGSWDTIVALRYPHLMFKLAPFPGPMAYYPYAVLVFLLGNIGINMWNRK